MNLHNKLRISLLLLGLVPLTGCLFRTHEIRRPVSTAALKDASKEQLIDLINTNAARLQSLKASDGQHWC